MDSFPKDTTGLPPLQFFPAAAGNFRELKITGLLILSSASILK
jgi:hypothetical protein